MISSRIVGSRYPGLESLDEVEHAFAWSNITASILLLSCSIMAVRRLR